MADKTGGFNNVIWIWFSQFDIQADAFNLYLTTSVVPDDYKNLVTAIFNLWQAHGVLKSAADGRLYDGLTQEQKEEYYRDNIEAGKKALQKALESLEGA